MAPAGRAELQELCTLQEAQEAQEAQETRGGRRTRAQARAAGAGSRDSLAVQSGCHNRERFVGAQSQLGHPVGVGDGCGMRLPLGAIAGRRHE